MTGTVTVIDLEKRIRELERALVREKEAMENRKQSERLFFSLIESLPLNIYSKDVDGRFIFANKEYCDTIGKKPSEILGKVDFDLHSLELARKFRKDDQVVMKSGQPKIIEERHREEHGNYAYVHVIKTPLFDSSRKVVGTIGIFWDISKRKLAEKTLRDSEEKYRAIFENTGTATVIVNAETIITMSNSEFEKMSGYTKAELEGVKSWKDFVAEKDLRRMEAYSRRRRMDGRSAPRNYEFEFVDRNGIFKTIHMTISMVPNSDDNVASLLDISDRRKMEESLKKSEEKYRMLFENANDMIFITQDGVIKFPNPKTEKVFGYSADELSSRPFTDFIHPDYRELVLGRYRKRLDGESPPGHYHFAITRKDGRDVDVEINSVLIDWGGSPASLNFLRDITEKKRLAYQLQQAHRMEAIGTLAGGVAHDLNNILSGITSYPELLLMDIPPDDPFYDPIMTIKNSGERAAVIVQDLLTLARRGVITREIVHCNMLIREYLGSPEFYNLQTYHPDVKVVTDLDDDIFYVSGSPVHLSKAIMNLITNGVEAMPFGGEVFVSTQNGHIDRPLTGYDHVNEGDYVVITVADAGIGMADQDRERIFEPFYTKKKMGRSGTGLGMAVVWGTVKDHRGYIHVNSVEGRGTTFTLYLPADREGARAVQTVASDASPDFYRGHGESVLIVDDVALQREVASRLLRKLNYSVYCASSGEEAIMFLQDQTVDLVILDMIMEPGIDGLETYEQILSFKPDQKAIIASGYSETDRVRKALKLGAGKYIKKPYTVKMLSKAVKEEIQKVF